MRGKPLDKQRVAELADRGFTREQIADELNVHPNSIGRLAAAMGRPLRRTAKRTCITCKQPRATEARWICRHCRAEHQRQGLAYVETHSLPGGLGRD